MIELNESQQNAYDYIIKNLPKKHVILLEGSAGTGKTTLTKAITNYYKAQVCAIAPTHKSKKVIQNILNQNTIIPISAFTVASALGKIKEHSYIGTKNYTNSSIKKLSSYRLFIIDEVSMINDNDLKIIVDYVINTKKQLLIIGDSNQIPCPSAKYLIGDVVERADSYVFTDENIPKVKLTTIVRQAKESPIIQLATFIRDHLTEDIPFYEIIEQTEFPNIIPYTDTYNIFRKLYSPQDVNSCRIIAYTNSSVKIHNLEARNAFGYSEDFVVGELLTGYSNIGYPELIIENGEDYIIQKITVTSIYSIGTFTNLHGNLIDIFVPSTGQKVNKLFFINIHHTNNTPFMMRLIELGEKINDIGSTKTDYKNYMQLKNSVIFIDDVYKYEGKIFTETSFKETHSLLFININDVIEDGKVLNSLLSKKLDTSYPGLMETRIRDKSKPFGDSETFADKYKVIEKDIYYGYSITAHKSQGSTYHSAIVDEADFQKIVNRWNHKYNKLETRIKEKNQLRYVGYTRAKNELYIIYQMEENETTYEYEFLED